MQNLRNKTSKQRGKKWQTEKLAKLQRTEGYQREGGWAYG